MIFEIEDKEQLNNWLKEHKCQYTNPNSVGAIGGKLTYCFTPTSLGCISRVTCACGEGIDTTFYEKW